MANAEEHYLDLLEQYEATHSNRERQRLLEHTPEYLTQGFAAFLEDTIAKGEVVIARGDAPPPVQHFVKRVTAIRHFLGSCREYGVGRVYHQLEQRIASQLHEFVRAHTWHEKRPLLRAHPTELTSDIADEYLDRAIAEARVAGNARAAAQLENHRHLLAAVRDFGLQVIEERMESMSVEWVPPDLQTAIRELEALVNGPATDNVAETAVRLLDSNTVRTALSPVQLRVASLCVTAFAQMGNEAADRRVRLCEFAAAAIHPHRTFYANWLSMSAYARFQLFESRGADPDLDQGLRDAETAIEVAHLPSTLSLTTVARMRLKRAQRTHTTPDLDRAQQLLEAHLELAPDLEARYLLAVVRAERGKLNEDIAEQDLAMDELTALVPQVAQDDDLLLQVHADLANGYGLRFDRGNATADLDRAIDHARLAMARAAGKGLRLVRDRLATYLRSRYDHHGRIADLHESIALLHELRLSVDQDVDPRLLFDKIGIALLLRFRHLGTLQDLEDGIDAFESAVRSPDSARVSREGSLNNLASAYRDLYAATGRDAAQERALALNRDVVAMTPLDSPERPGHLHNLGIALKARAHDASDRAMLDEAIETLKEAVRLTRPDSQDHPNHCASLAGALYERFLLSEDPSSLDSCIKQYRDVVERSAPNARWAHLASLGAGLQARHELTKEISDRQEAVECFRRCLEEWSQQGPGAWHAAGVADRWGWWASEREATDEAIEAYGHAIEAMRATFTLQDKRAHKEIALQSMGAVAGRAAYAFVRAGEAARAVEALESGRTLLLNDALGPLENAATGARTLDGFSSDPAPHTVADVRSAASDSPLVYLVAVNDSPLAIIVGCDGSIRPVWMPRMGAPLLSATTEYNDAHQSRHQNWERWMAAQHAFVRALWESFIGPLLPELRPHGRAVLIPTGVLSLMPLHAAALPDSSRPTGFRYALDEIAFSYAPNARLVSAARRDAARTALATVLAVSIPLTPGALPLIHSRHEAKAATAGLKDGNVLVLHGANATADEVVRLMPRFAVHHFSCHGKSMYRTPLEAYLLLAGGDRLTLRRVLEQRLQGVRLVVLSACESGVQGQNLLDEAIGLPAGFLQAGATGVIASQWDVPELSTMELMVRFYDLWRAGAVVPEALRTAQQQVRDTTTLEKEEYLGARLDGWHSPWAAFLPDERPFAHVAYWGAFAHFGV